MAVLALRLCGHANAVSQLHARVSRRLWLGLAPGARRRGRQDPRDHERRSPADVDRPGDRARSRSSRAPRAVPPARALERCTRGSARAARRRLPRAAVAPGRGAPALRRRSSRGRRAVLDPNALTIGFARRFATYKRANLILRDPDRLARMLAATPSQILFAGKAHPHDEPGQGAHSGDRGLRRGSRVSGAGSFCSPTTTCASRARSSRAATSG